jgi:hypothetical protein
MIQPSIGRVVWYFPSKDHEDINKFSDQPMAALVTHVWGDRCINIAAFDHHGSAFPVQSVTLLQDHDAPLEGGRYAMWMPYQIAQAAKHAADPETVLAPDPQAPLPLEPAPASTPQEAAATLGMAPPDAPPSSGA